MLVYTSNQTTPKKKTVKKISKQSINLFSILRTCFNFSELISIVTNWLQLLRNYTNGSSERYTMRTTNPWHSSAGALCIFNERPRTQIEKKLQNINSDEISPFFDTKGNFFGFRRPKLERKSFRWELVYLTFQLSVILLLEIFWHDFIWF